MTTKPQPLPCVTTKDADMRFIPEVRASDRRFRLRAPLRRFLVGLADRIDPVIEPSIFKITIERDDRADGTSFSEGQCK